MELCSIYKNIVVNLKADTLKCDILYNYTVPSVYHSEFGWKIMHLSLQCSLHNSSIYFLGSMKYVLRLSKYGLYVSKH
jgi:uncharacterized secreted protein with C-terminal beta-propeller domain